MPTSAIHQPDSHEVTSARARGKFWILLAVALVGLCGLLPWPSSAAAVQEEPERPSIFGNYWGARLPGRDGTGSNMELLLNKDDYRPYVETNNGLIPAEEYPRRAVMIDLLANRVVRDEIFDTHLNAVETDWRTWVHESFSFGKVGARDQKYEYNDLYKEFPRQGYTNEHTITLNFPGNFIRIDGHLDRVKLYPDGDRGLFSTFYRFVLGPKTYEFVLVEVLDQSRPFNDRVRDSDPTYVWQRRGRIAARGIYFDYQNIYILTDRTILALDSDGWLAIRFDHQMRSPFIDADPRLMMLSPQLVKGWIDQVTARFPKPYAKMTDDEQDEAIGQIDEWVADQVVAHWAATKGKGKAP